MTGAGPNQLGVFGPQVRRTGIGGNFAHEPRARREMLVTASSLTLKDSDSGSLIVLLRAAGTAVTLPVTPRSGCFFEFYCGINVSGGSHVITATSDELYVGAVLSVDTDTSGAMAGFMADLSNDVIFTINGSTQGGLKGSWVTMEFVQQAAGSDGLWRCNGVMLATGNPATNFS